MRDKLSNTLHAGHTADILVAIDTNWSIDRTEIGTGCNSEPFQHLDDKPTVHDIVRNEQRSHREYGGNYARPCFLSDRARVMLKRNAYIAAFCAAVLFGGNFVAVRIALDYFDPYLLTTLRFALIAALVPFVGWPDVSARTLITYTIGSGIGQYLLSTFAIQLGLSPGLAALLLQFQVFISLALGFLFLGEKVRATTILGSVMGIAGLVGVLAAGGRQAPMVASFVCLLSAAGWAVANMTLKQTSERVIRLQSASALICLPAVWAARTLMLPEAPQVAEALTRAPLVGWLAVAYVAIASFVVAQILWARAIASIGLASTSPVALLIPVFGVALAALLLGEHLNARVLMSAAIVLAGVGMHVVPIALRPSKDPISQS
ncbi:DMT family transporter [Bradyrhizobium sp. USDA 4353]